LVSLRPRLIVVAGPNGAGKTSITEAVLRHEWMQGCVYINPDNIARDEFGDWNSPEAVIKAANLAAERREQCLKERKDLAFETVLSGEDKVDFAYSSLAPATRRSTPPASRDASCKADTKFPSEKLFRDTANRSRTAPCSPAALIVCTFTTTAWTARAPHFAFERRVVRLPSSTKSHQFGRSRYLRA
jgi:hypothetical protein